MADRRKTLEALVAKRKAETENTKRAPKSKTKPSSAALKVRSPLGKPPSKLSSPSLLLKKKKDSPAQKKKRKVEKYDTDDDDEEEEDDDDDDDESDVDVVKKKPSSKTLPSKVVSTPKNSLSVKGKTGVKEKLAGKEKPDVRKPGSKRKESSDEGGSDEDGEDDTGGDSGDEGIDLSNVLPDRSRRRSGQSVNYKIAGGSDDNSD